MSSDVGQNSNFRCARCNQPRRLLGRRKLRVQGLMQYVCAECVTKHLTGASERDNMASPLLSP